MCEQGGLQTWPSYMSSVKQNDNQTVYVCGTQHNVII